MPDIPPIALDKLIRMSPVVDAAPIVEDASLSAMTDGATETRQRIGGKIVLMAAVDQPDARPTRAAASRGKLMDAAPARPSTAKTALPAKDQALPPAPAEEPGSVRLRLRVDRGRVTVIGAHAVPGSVETPERLDYGLAYEVKDGAKRIAIGSVTDIGERRSYPDPEGRAGMSGHHVSPLDSFEVNVRVPLGSVKEATLPRLNITLFRMKEQPERAITPAPLAEQFGDQLRPVAELKGLHLDGLSEPIQAQLRGAIQARLTPER